MPKVELLLDAHATIAESLLWEPRTALLYWIDVKKPALYRLDPQTLQQRCWPLTSEIGGFALFEDRDAALVALRSGLYELSLDDGALKQLAPPPFDPALYRFNESSCDAGGRFWVGTMFDPLPGHKEKPAQTGPLSSWNAGEGLVLRPGPAELHNGMAWSPNGQTFYISHSKEKRIYAHDFNAAAGTLDNRWVFAHTPHDAGIPDGAAVDEEGAYWCAMHGGNRLLRYGTQGNLLMQLDLPVSQPTKCTFGSAEMDTLFISSASDKLDAQQLEREPHAGGLFWCKPGVRGAPRQCYVR